MAPISRVVAVVALVGLLTTLAGSLAPPAVDTGQVQGPQMAAVPGEGTPGDDDPRIDESEIIAPTMDSRDPAWVPAYKWHEDPASLECGGRRACEDYKGNKTTSSQTSSGANR